MKSSKKEIIASIPLALISLELYFGLLFGYVVGYVFGGKKTGGTGIIKSIKFKIGNHKIHLHHWLIAIGILISTAFYNYFPITQFSFGFLGGLVFQGVSSYKDWFKILIKEK